MDDVRTAIKQYADIDRVSVETEVVEDIDEMGATERCPGYNTANADNDG